MDAASSIVIGSFCSLGCYSVLHVGRRIYSRHKPRRMGYLHGGSNRPTASTTMRAVGMRSQIGWVARQTTMEDYRSMLAPGGGWLLQSSLEIPPPHPPRNNSPWPIASGYATGASGAETNGPDPAPNAAWPKIVSDAEAVEALGCDPRMSGFESRRTLSPMAELWGDFEWEDAA